jgi:hypothetical protein
VIHDDPPRGEPEAYDPPPPATDRLPPHDDGPWFDHDAEPRFPWPPGPDDSVLAAFVRTWQGASLRPAPFFRAMPDRASLGAALLYYLPLGILVAGADLFWRTVRDSTPEEHAVLGAASSIPPIVSFLLSPLILLLSLFIAAGVTHLLLKAFGGASRDLVVTTRVFAFAYSPQLLGVVPVIGTVTGFIWMVFVGIIGVREAHDTTTGRATAAVLIPVVIGLIFFFIAMFLAAAGELLQLPV